MKIYILLRDNKESGPFALEEIRTMSLKPFDLVWVEGQSKGWSYPEEIAELQGFVRDKETVDNIPGKTKAQSKLNHGKARIFVSLPSQHVTATHSYAHHEDSHEEPVLETKYSKPLDEIKELYVEHLAQNKSIFKNTFNRPSPAWLLGLFGGLILCAFTVKKIVEGFDENRMANQTSQAIIPYDENSRPVNYNAPLATEALAVDTVAEKPKPVKKLNLTKMVSVEKNDFTVGVFGGINNLKLDVYNSSPYALDKVVISVEYLKPNDEVVKKENVEVFSVNPKSSKSINVPASNRGVKVRTKVTKVSSKKYKASLLQI